MKFGFRKSSTSSSALSWTLALRSSGTGGGGGFLGAQTHCRFGCFRAITSVLRPLLVAPQPPAGGRVVPARHAVVALQIDLPLLLHEHRDHAQGRPAVGPRQDVWPLRRLGAEAA